MGSSCLASGPYYTYVVVTARTSGTPHNGHTTHPPCHLRSVAFVLTLVREGLVIPASDVHAHLVRLGDLATRYANRNPDLADLCLIRLSELHRRHTVITVDRDFRVYRGNKREAIPITSPPDC